MSETFKIGILADNYKIEKFKLELVLKGYIHFRLIPNLKDLSLTTILVDTEPGDMMKIKKICEEVEDYFRAQKN